MRALSQASLKRILLNDASGVDTASIERQIQSAIILASASEDRYTTAAYRIATSAVELASHELNGLPHALHIILARLGNFPALTFASSRFELSPFVLPIQTAGETLERIRGNSVRLEAKGEIVLTDFQKHLWDELQAGGTISISAPTSAGKSFILQTYARSRFASGAAANICFIVPTRALINQVSSEAAAWLKELGQGELITTPVPSTMALPAKAVYVVTQERLQLLLTNHDVLEFDMLVVDEAQSLGDGPRGVLLATVIDDVLRRRPECQLLFAGPSLSNPGELGSIFGRHSRPVKTSSPTVDQNIIFVDSDPVSLCKASLSLLFDGEKLSLGAIETDEPLTDHRSKLVNLALALGREGQSLIYAAGPAECEKIGFGIADVDGSAAPPQLSELSAFVKEAVHPKFALADYVLAGVGFHYGRLPALVRRSVEDAFGDGDLKYLVTTSTLLHGVNLPARNLFLHNPHTGVQNPISPIDFWNLAGRAGRLGKEFSGNIFLIDYGSWESKPMEGEREREVRSSLQMHVDEFSSDLLDYINEPSSYPQREQEDEFENTFVRLFNDYNVGRLDQTLDRLGIHASDPRRGIFADALSRVASSTNLPPKVFQQSPTVSVYRQQALYDWIVRSLKKKDPAYVIPRHPMQEHSYTSLVAAIKRCHGAILGYPSGDKSHYYFALIALQWMKGTPLPQIIDSAFSHKKKNGNPNLASVIRDTLTDIETKLRFRYVKLLSCYDAVLKHALSEGGYPELIRSVPALPLYLEVGACSTTMISFMGLGLSRFTAGKLNQLARRTGMAQDEARAWLRGQRIEAFDVPNASRREIERMLL